MKNKIQLRTWKHKISCFLICTLLAAGTGFCLPDPEVFASDNGNIALGKPVKVAGFGINSAFPAEYVTDGNFGTRVASSGGATGTLTIDLSENVNFNRIVLAEMASAGGYRSTNFTLSYSADNKSWQTICEETNGMGEKPGDVATYSFDPVVGRYVRIVITAGTNGVSIYEFQVYSDYLSFDQSGFTDSDTGKFSDEAEFLTAFGFLTAKGDGSFGFQDVVNKTNMANLLVKVLNFDVGKYNRDPEPIDFTEATEQTVPTPIFEDVPLENKNIENIELVTNLGLMQPLDETHFGPNEPISQAQLLRYMVRVLGYQEYAMLRGGDPMGYVQTANELDLLNGIQYSASETVTKDVLARMLYTVLHTDMLQQTSFGSRSQFVTEKGMTPLAKYHNIYQARGVVAGNHQTMLTGESHLSESQVSIDGTVYLDEAGAGNLLGYNIDYYYNDRDGDFFVVYAEKNKKNDELKITAEDIASVTHNQINYTDESGRQKKVSLPADIDVIYNGNASIRSNEELDEALRNMKNGTICLIDNGVNAGYHTMIVESYQTYALSGVDYAKGQGFNSDNHMIFDADLENSNVSCMVYDSKGMRKFTSLQNGDIVSVAKSQDGRILKIGVGTDEVSGVFRGYSSSGRSITIDDQDYKLAPDHQLKAEQGQMVTLKFDCDGRGFLVSSSGEQKSLYAYLYGIRKFGAFDDNVECCFFTQNEEWVTYSLADKVRYNGDVVEAAAVLSFLTNGGATVQQIVKFTENNGKCKALETDISDSLSDSNAQADAISRGRLVKTWDKLASYKSNLFYEKNRILYVGNDTVIFAIPKDGDREKFTISFGNQLTNNKTYEVKLYDSLNNENAAAAMITTKGDFGSYNEGGPMFILTGITLALGEDGEVYEKITGFENGAEKQYFLMENGILNGYKAGDMMQLGTNKRGQVTGVIGMRKIDELRNGIFTPYGNVGSYNGVIYGRVTDIHGKMVEIENDEGQKQNYKVTSSFYVCQDEPKRNVYVGNITDIQRGNVVAIRFKLLNVQEVVIYQFEQ